MNKQILQKTKHLEELRENHSNLQSRYNDTKKTLTELKSHSEKLDKEQEALEKVESKADPSILQNLRALVAMNENLKIQEQEFKAHCREEMTRLQQEIEKLKAERAPGSDEKTLQWRATWCLDPRDDSQRGPRQTVQHGEREAVQDPITTGSKKSRNSHIASEDR